MKKLQPFLSVLILLVIVLGVKYVIQLGSRASIEKNLKQSISEELSKSNPSPSPSPTAPHIGGTLERGAWPSPTSSPQWGTPQTAFGTPTPKYLIPKPSRTGVNSPVSIVGDCELPNCVRTPINNLMGVSTTVTILEDGGAQNRDTVFNQMSKCYVPYGSALILEHEWDNNYVRAKVRTMEGTYGLMCPNGISVAVEKKLWWKYTPQFLVDEQKRLNKTTQ